MTPSHAILRRTSRAVHALALGVGLLGLAGAGRAQEAEPGNGPLKVLATVPTYGELAREIGGSHVDVFVVCRPAQDLHTVTATPSVLARARGTQLVLYTGLDTEPWLDPLLRGSGNTQLFSDPDRMVVLSDGIPLKEVPSELTRRSGDVHVFGNTHVWTDPLAVRMMAERVRDALSGLDPAHAADYRSRHADFHKRLTHAMVRWLTDYAGLKDETLVTYHRSWIYLLERFGMVRAGTLEPKPRVTPTAAHLGQLVETMQRDEVSAVVREPFQHHDATDFLSESTGARVIVLSTHPGFPEEADGIIEHFDHNLAALAAALDVEVPSRP